MIAYILKQIIETLCLEFPADRVKAAIDKALDKIEDRVKKSKNPLDDLVVLPFIKACIRRPFGIEDNDPAETTVPK